MTVKIETGVIIFLDALGVSKYKQAAEFLDFFCEMKKMKIRAQYVWDKWREKFSKEKIILPHPKIIIFQDSIIICFPDMVEKENTLHNFFAAQNWVMAAYIVAIEKKIFFRGAMSHGEYVYSESNGTVAVLGSPIVDASNYEKESEKKPEWIGVIQTEEFQRQYLAALGQYANVNKRDVKEIIEEYERFYVKYKVPLKTGQKMEHYVVNWPTILHKHGTTEIKAILTEACHLAEKKDKPKYENTLAFVQFCEDNQFFIR
ncbi:MAG: hypothetical protein NTV68_15665 [Methanomicrobiales archaeon]|nr:hypothetical protein [Methanomicrobiales archaeon]